VNTDRDRDGRGLQREARALGDPTRHAVFRYVDAARRPVTVAELTEHFGLNHNAIRQHLAKLCEAGVLTEELAAPAGPGRRRLRYRAAPAVAGPWGGDSPYEQLSLLLLELLQTGGSPRQVGFEAGRRFARRHGARAVADELDEFEALVARQGFEPRRVERSDAVELVLEQCPFAAAAEADPAIVCELHRGLAEGMADTIGGDVAVTGLVARNPQRAGCRLQTRQGGSQHV
jgi:predicted ArsR family transcriptional regulator